MKRERIVGLFIISISLLTFSMQISMAYLSKYVDQVSGSFWSDGYEYKYIPTMVYVFLVLSLGIGVYLSFKEPILKLLKKIFESDEDYYDKGVK